MLQRNEGRKREILSIRVTPRASANAEGERCGELGPEPSYAADYEGDELEMYPRP